jgi:hypothetical protein
MTNQDTRIEKSLPFGRSTNSGVFVQKYRHTRQTQHACLLHVLATFRGECLLSTSKMPPALNRYVWGNILDRKALA